MRNNPVIRFWIAARPMINKFIVNNLTVVSLFTIYYNPTGVNHFVFFPPIIIFEEIIPLYHVGYPSIDEHVRILIPRILSTIL